MPNDDQHLQKLKGERSKKMSSELKNVRASKGFPYTRGLTRIKELPWKGMSYAEMDQVIEEHLYPFIDEGADDLQGMVLLGIGWTEPAADPRPEGEKEDDVYSPGSINFTFTDGCELYEARVFITNRRLELDIDDGSIDDEEEEIKWMKTALETAKETVKLMEENTK
jgi:hypothetical protein